MPDKEELDPIELLEEAEAKEKLAEERNAARQQENLRRAQVKLRSSYKQSSRSFRGSWVRPDRDANPVKKSRRTSRSSCLPTTASKPRA